MTILLTAVTAEDVGGAALRNTTAGNFEAGYSSECWQASVTSAYYPQFIQNFPAPVGDLWMHFLYRTNSASAAWSNAGSTGQWFTFYDAAGNALARIDWFGAGGPRVEVVGDTTVQGTAAVLTQNALTTIDVRLAVSAASITLEYYVNGVLTSTATAANTVGGKGKPVKVAFEHANIWSSATAALVSYSQLIITDAESTIGWKIADMRPTSAGGDSAWSGDYVSLMDADPATRISSDTAGQRESWNLTAYGGAASPAGGIRAVVSRSRAQKGTSGPTKFKHYLKISSVNYDGADKSPNGVDWMTQEWANNPATSAPWTVANLTGLQAGVLSVA